MLSIIISSLHKERLDRCINSIKKTSGVPVELLVTHNPGKYPLGYVYNKAAHQATHPNLLFLHEDTEFKSKHWGQHLLSLLQRPNVGLVGVAGTTYLPDNASWVSPGVPYLKGRIIHESPASTGKDQIEIYSPEQGTFDVVAIDGVFMATTKTIMNTISFDHHTFNGFHFYDMDISMQIGQHHTILVTTDILIKHYSGGNPGPEWNHYRHLFIKKYKHLLPRTNQTTTPDWNNITHWTAQPVTYTQP